MKDLSTETSESGLINVNRRGWEEEVQTRGLWMQLELSASVGEGRIQLTVSTFCGLNHSCLSDHHKIHLNQVIGAETSGPRLNTEM